MVTGVQRPATSPESVIIYTEPLVNYEVIGLVSASSDSGWTNQGSLEYAVEEIKKQAARIGANGILLDNITQTTSGETYYNGVFSASTSQNISGKAIYIEEK